MKMRLSILLLAVVCLSIGICCFSYMPNFLRIAPTQSARRDMVISGLIASQDIETTIKGYSNKDLAYYIINSPINKDPLVWLLSKNVDMNDLPITSADVPLLAQDEDDIAVNTLLSSFDNPILTIVDFLPPGTHPPALLTVLDCVEGTIIFQLAIFEGCVRYHVNCEGSLHIYESSVDAELTKQLISRVNP